MVKQKVCATAQTFCIPLCLRDMRPYGTTMRAIGMSSVSVMPSRTTV